MVHFKEQPFIMLAYNMLHPLSLLKIKNEGLRNNNTTLLNDISEVKLIDDFTVEIRIAKDIEFELDDAIHINEIAQKIGKGERLFHLTIYMETEQFQQKKHVAIPSPSLEVN